MQGSSKISIGLTTASAVRLLKSIAKISINYRGQRNRVFREEIFRAVRHLAPAIAVDVDGLWYYVSTEDYGISRGVFGSGEFDLDIMCYAIGLAEEETGRRPLLRNKCFVDIGANVGTSTLPALLRFGADRALAFEPDPRSFALLRCNLIANGVEERVDAYGFALSSVDGSGSLEHCVDSWGDNRIRVTEGMSDGSFRESQRATSEVQLRTLDSIVAEGAIDPSDIGLLWMDVQGHEGQVLAGASSVLAAGMPAVVEYWPYGLRRAGGLEIFHEAVSRSFKRVVDVRSSMAAGSQVSISSDKIEGLASRYGEESFTDLLLLP